MQCPACGGETPDGKRFCANCGAALDATCPTCGAELIAGKAFCADCGTKVGAVVAGVPRAIEPAPGGDNAAERRLCSVLFVDLVGFTPLAERADPEDVRDLLRHYFDRAERVISNYGGTVEKFIGDAVVAVWGAPIANEDDAERAVRAGLDVVSGVAALGRELGRDGLGARAAVVTGEVAITVGKVSEGMLAGDTVNSASRLQGAAEPGSVLVDEATWRASSGAIAYGEPAEFTLKGKADPMAAWRALRVVAQRKGLGRSEGLEPPFVGRDDDLRLVKDLLHATERERRPRLVSVTGVPGIGKSRLAWEFLKYVDGLAETVYWHQGRSAAYGSGVTFGALGEMVRMRAGIDETEDAEAAREKLHASISEYVDDDDRRWIEPRLAHLLGLAEAPSGGREELFSAWRAFFQSIARRGPTVLVFEDLQWADAGLMDFIESLLEWSRTDPIMVMTLSRPELRDLRPEWGTAQASFTSLHLDPLPDEAMDQLLNGFVAGLPPEIVVEVRQRAEGVPLYAVETIRMLVDRGVLVAEEAGYVVKGELGTLDIPETLHALVASRLDALPAEERRLLQDAAVLGTTVHPDSLAAVLGTTRSSLDPMLRNLVRKEFLRLDTDPRSPERGQFHFVQGVVAEVALSMLSRRDRSARHLAVARYFEATGDEELTGVVAAQYASAHRAAPETPDHDDLASAASTWLRRAGDRAASLGSLEQALDFYSQALELTSSGATRGELLEAAGDAATLAGRGDQARSLLREAVTIYGELGDKNGVGRASARIAFALAVERHYADALSIAEAAYLELGAEGDLEVRARLAIAIAGSYGHGLDLHKAVEWGETALELTEQLDDLSLFGEALYSRGLALFSLGRHRESLMLHRGLVGLAESAGLIREQSRTLMALGLCTMADDPVTSARNVLDAAEQARRAGVRPLQQTNLLNYAELCVLNGSWDEARRALAELGPLVESNAQWAAMLQAMLAASTGDHAGAAEWMRSQEHDDTREFIQAAATTYQCSAFVALAAGDLATAMHDADRAIQIDPLGINVHVAISVLGRAALWSRDVEGARRALEAGRRVRGRWSSATLDDVQAGIDALEGRVEEAANGFGGAVAAFGELDCHLAAALVTLDRLVLLGPAQDAAVAEAERTFTRLGALPYLERLRQVQATA